MDIDSAAIACSALSALELTALRQASKAWRETADAQHLWAALAKQHFCFRLQQGICDRRAFARQVIDFRSALDKAVDMEIEPSTFSSLLLDIAYSPQPFPPLEENGVSELVNRGIHIALAGVFMFSLIQRTLDPSHNWCELLDFVCNKNCKAHKEIRSGFLSRSNTFRLPGLLEELLMSHFPSLRELQPEFGEDSDSPVISRFACLDCRLLSLESSHMRGLRATCGLHFHFFAEEDDAHDVSALVSEHWHKKDWATMAAELSGDWCTAASLNGRRLSSVPGDLQIRFETGGVLRGRGCDEFDPVHEFSITGFWTVEMVFMRKIASNYSADLLGFFQPDGCIRGTWLIDTRTGGFWAWKGSPRFATYGNFSSVPGTEGAWTTVS